jgi:phosphatidylglycerol:prolipoprotein diacylglycerol transferase
MTFFPLLAYLVVAPQPFLIEFGHSGYGLRYYPIAYITGFFLTYVSLKWQAKQGWSLLKGADIEDLICWVCLAGVMVGGRLGYCLLYASDKLWADPFMFFRVWEGGMASHGGIFGVILVLIFYARYKKIPFYNLSDAGVLFVPLCLAIGRCANFLNGELWGRPSTVPWAIIFTSSTPIDHHLVPRHPSQLYEALLEGLLLQLILLVVRFSTRVEGVVSLTFMAGYAILRIVGEQFREPDVGIDYWYGLTRGQILSFIMLSVTAILILFKIWAVLTNKRPETP